MSQVLGGGMLLELARSRQPEDRERLLLAIADLGAAGPAAMENKAVQALLGSVFLRLISEVERDIRERLALKIADAEWAPPALVNLLALDEIEIARPVISRSPVLEDADLMTLMVQATVEHQIEVARRPCISEEVVAAIIARAEPAVLTALAGNHTAGLSARDMEELVEASRRIAAMRLPLADHPKLSEALARRMYLWAGVALRQGLADRFRLDSAELDGALAAAVLEAQHGTSPEAVAARVAHDAGVEETETRLIHKLDDAGQLRPAFLIRALREEKLGLFIMGLARLGRFDIQDVRRILNSDRPELLALACLAVGIDRSVFPDILERTRALNGGRPGGGAEGARRAHTAFAPVSTEVASAAFRQAAKTLARA